VVWVRVAGKVDAGEVAVSVSFGVNVDTSINASVLLTVGVLLSVGGEAVIQALSTMEPSTASNNNLSLSLDGIIPSLAMWPNGEAQARRELSVKSQFKAPHKTKLSRDTRPRSGVACSVC
jgi:hypothetical protein